MTQKQADKLIKTGTVTTFKSSYGETFTGTVVSRNRFSLNILVTETGKVGVFSRDDLVVVNNNKWTN
jgi:hypothetical protein